MSAADKFANIEDKGYIAGKFFIKREAEMYPRVVLGMVFIAITLYLSPAATSGGSHPPILMRGCLALKSNMLYRKGGILINIYPASGAPVTTTRTNSKGCFTLRAIYSSKLRKEGSWKNGWINFELLAGDGSRPDHWKHLWYWSVPRKFSHGQWRIWTPNGTIPAASRIIRVRES